MEKYYNYAQDLHIMIFVDYKIMEDISIFGYAKKVNHNDRNMQRRNL